jgi:hypothetical protein
VVPLTYGSAKPAQISYELGLLNALDLSTAPDPGQVLFEFLTRRETELRLALKSAP